MRTIFVLAVMAFSVVTATAQSPAEDASEQEQRNARPRVMFLPYFSLASEDESDLFLVSKVAHPIEIDVFATAPSGQQVYLGREVLPPSRGSRIGLKERLRPFGDEFSTGTLRLDYVGDSGTLQAWVVIRSRLQTFEIPFVSQEKAANREFISFWDAWIVGPQPKLGAEYRLTNTTEVNVPFSVSIHDGPNIVEEIQATLPPRETRIIRVTKGRTIHRGWLRLNHSGPVGAIIGAGVLVSHQKTLAYLPLQPVSETQKGPVFEILSVPVDRTPLTGDVRSEGGLTLFNSGIAPQDVVIEVVDRASGRVLQSHSRMLSAWKVEHVRLEELLGRQYETELRLRIRGSAPSLVIRGAVVTDKGSVLDLSVHSLESAHRSGTYPIPDLRDFEVRTTIINLGSDEAEILAQYFWNGGTFAAPALRIPPGGSAVLDPQRYVAQGTVDALDRQLDPRGMNMALKWSRRGGSDELIGRTEVWPIGSADGFGFNCGGCCWEYPRGAVNPDEVEVGLNEAISFTPYVWWDTCSGTMGPWQTSPYSADVPPPFSWDYENLTTSDGADEEIAFDAAEWAVLDSCSLVFWPFRGWGLAKACQKVWNPANYDKNQPCTVQTPNCTKCYECCAALYAMKICQKYRSDLALSEKNTCDGTCAGECQG